MQQKNHGFESRLRRRLRLASRPENMGDDLTTRDYAWLAIVTVLVPGLLMLTGWYL